MPAYKENHSRCHAFPHSLCFICVALETPNIQSDFNLYFWRKLITSYNLHITTKILAGKYHNPCSCKIVRVWIPFFVGVTLFINRCAAGLAWRIIILHNQVKITRQVISATFRLEHLKLDGVILFLNSEGINMNF